MHLVACLHAGIMSILLCVWACEGQFAFALPQNYYILNLCAYQLMEFAWWELGLRGTWYNCVCFLCLYITAQYEANIN
jgi:hypothetical protein